MRQARIDHAVKASVRRHRAESGELVAEHAAFIIADVRSVIPDATELEIGSALAAIGDFYSGLAAFVEAENRKHGIEL